MIMKSLEQISINKDWKRTRRNIISMGAVLVGLCGCHSDSKHRHRSAQCYLEGTNIRTIRGERRIEDLRIGDLVITGDSEPKPIEWIGRRRYRRPLDGAWPESIKPVRIVRDAFGPNMPHSDLFLSQEHNLFVDGILIRAVDLLNGTSLVIDPCDAQVWIEYLHIKLATHDVIFAEGLLSETLRFNADSVGAFDNFTEFERLYGPAVVDETPCAPVCTVTTSGGRARLSSHLRSALSPWIDRRNKFEILRDRLLDGAGAAA